ncbi:hypothetical protein Leryth_020619 [Lithospermum erythrorhizon]|nr:hypothetical protein Leryth_020619 [Lithospermum erythrorhizon]
MAGRHHMPRENDNFHGYHGDLRAHLSRRPVPLPPHPIALEEELELQHREMEGIVVENRNVVEDNVTLQRELTAVKDEIRRLGEVIPQVRADGDDRRRELLDRGLKLEAELRAAEHSRKEAAQLRAEAKKLNVMQQDLSSEVKKLTKDIDRLKPDNKQVASIKADLNGIHKDLAEVRRTFEYEKKANEELLEQNHVLEKNLLSAAREIEKLRAEKRARDVARS